MVSASLSSRPGGLKALDIFNLINVDDLDPAEGEQSYLESSTYAASEKCFQENDSRITMDCHGLPVQTSYGGYAEESLQRFHLMNSSPPATMDPRLTMSGSNLQDSLMSNNNAQDEGAGAFMFASHLEESEKLLRFSSDDEYQVRLAKVNASLNALDYSLLAKRNVFEKNKTKSRIPLRNAKLENDSAVDPNLYFDRSENLIYSSGISENQNNELLSNVSEFDKIHVQSSMEIMSSSNSISSEEETHLNTSFDGSQEKEDQTLVDPSFLGDDEGSIRRNPIRKTRAKSLPMTSDPPQTNMKRKRKVTGNSRFAKIDKSIDEIYHENSRPKPQSLAHKGDPGLQTKRRRQQNLPRSRNGCWTCRARRKKCDETQPYCLACKSLGLACAGYSSRRPCFMEDPVECQKYKAEVSSQIKQFKRLKKSSIAILSSSEVAA